MFDAARFQVRPGDVIAGKYRVERVLGAGGMGVVVAAFHLVLQERVALKFMLAPAGEDSERGARFLREARAAVRIKSDNVVRVSDVGALEDGTPFLVMEYLDGNDLATELKQRGRFAVTEAVDLVLQACEALAEAHVLGIVHRDLKPSNLFLTRRANGAPWIKVLDFGISKVASSVGEASITRSSAALGSPLYMSPEQLRSARDVDVRTDVWALGVVLYELVSGAAPFLGETASDVIVKVATEPAPRLVHKCPEVPLGLEAVILRCLEKDRDLRPANTAELAMALAEFGTAQARASAEHIVGVMEAATLSITERLTPGAAARLADTEPQVQVPRLVSLPPQAKAVPVAPAERTLSNVRTTEINNATWGVSEVEPKEGRRVWVRVVAVAGLAACAVGVYLVRSSRDNAGAPVSGAADASAAVAPMLVSEAASSASVIEPVPSASAVASVPPSSQTSVPETLQPARQPPARVRSTPHVVEGTPAKTQSSAPKARSSAAKPTPEPATSATPPAGGKSVFDNRKF